MGTTKRLPTPIGRQKEVLCLPAQGHFAVLGTAGSGKTTLAILRSAYLSDPRTDHSGRTLLVTFNRALVAYLRHLQDRDLSNVVVENYHTFARGYLNSRGKMPPRNGICSDLDERKRLIESAKNEVAARYEKHPFFDRPIDVYSEEIRWISQHGISSLKAYTSAERIGRAGARIARKYRKVMFEIYENYIQKRTDSGKLYDWDDLASATRQELEHDDSARLYQHIVIDEGQDFSPEMIRSLALAVPPDGSLTFFGDVAHAFGREIKEGAEAFMALFADSVQGASGYTFHRTSSHLLCCPTDEQAEVLIPDRVPLNDILGIVASSEEQVKNELSRFRHLGIQEDRFKFIIAPTMFKKRALSTCIRSGRRPTEKLWSPGGSNDT